MVTSVAVEFSCASVGISVPVSGVDFSNRPVSRVANYPFHTPKSVGMGNCVHNAEVQSAEVLRL